MRLSEVACGSFVKSSTAIRSKMSSLPGSPSKRAVELASIDISDIVSGPDSDAAAIPWVARVVSIAARVASQYVARPMRVDIDCYRSFENCSISAAEVISQFRDSGIFASLDYVCGRILIDSAKIAFSGTGDRQWIHENRTPTAPSYRVYLQAMLADELANVYSRNRVMSEFGGWSGFFNRIAGNFDYQVSQVIMHPGFDPVQRAVYAVILGASGGDCEIGNDIAAPLGVIFDRFLAKSSKDFRSLGTDIVDYLYSIFPQEEIPSPEGEGSEGESEGAEGEGEGSEGKSEGKSEGESEGEGSEGEPKSSNSSADRSTYPEEAEHPSLAGRKAEDKPYQGMQVAVLPGGGVEDREDAISRGIRVDYMQIPPIYVDDTATAKKISDQYLRYFSDLRWQVNRPPTPEHGTRSGDIDEGNLYRLASLRDPGIFSRRPDLGQARNAIGVLLDCSGSMWTDDRMTSAKGICHALAKTFEADPKVNTLILGHSTGPVSGGKQHVKMYEAKNVDDILKMTAVDSNADGVAIKEIASRVRKMRGLRRSIIVIADGQPSSHGYRGQAAREHTAKVVRSIRASRIDVFTIIIGDGVSSERADHMYGKGMWIRALTPSESGSVVGKVLRRILASGGAE